MCNILNYELVRRKNRMLRKVSNTNLLEEKMSSIFNFQLLVAA